MTWVLLKSLGDHVLYLCTNNETDDLISRKCYSSSSAYCSAAGMGLERGCLFYTLPKDQTLYIFEVEDNATTVIMPCLKLPAPWFLPTWIMMPTEVNSQVAGRRKRMTDLLLSQDTTETSIVEENMTWISRGGESEALKQWDFLDDYDSTEEIARHLHQWITSIFTICSIVDPMHSNDKYPMKLSDQLLVGVTVRFSKHGWLLLSNGKKIVFCYNPFTRELIFLPDIPGHNYILGGMSFSSVPTSRDSVVIAISNWWEMMGNNEISLLVTKLGQSATGWTIHRSNYKEYSIEDYFMLCITNPVFYNGAFYCLDYNGMLGVFNMKGGFSWKVLSKSLKQFGGFYPSYLHALFISNTSSFSAVAPRSCMENNIYFPRLYGERILYYSLDTLRYHCVGSDQHTSQDFRNTKERSNST
ncbi:hypothetical protein MKW98_030649 [Papaver atlanticum]|uniref:KIB1-4 beta-propeller domain-containing protein n=1 Tax=Papaver atlanticum TaxID=357466 RepID=A0AAD4RTW7_9MAGN|nr:hypothetical protein MKW98_030649 [Papaver atlanticum]